MPPPAAPPEDDGYGREKERSARRSRQRSAVGREIGAVPEIADVERRERCRDSLRLFCETYNPAAFSMGWSDGHLKAIARIEEAATLGALYAFAMERGAGKTTICRMGALWAMSYRHCRYAFLIGATDAKALQSLDTLRVLMRFLDAYAEDFPEISHPARALGGIANRASGQTCGGESTLIEWSADRVVLATVPPPPNWPKHWPLRQADGMVPTSGSLVSASGLTGEGLRGSLKTLTTGEMVRPDLVLIDDPQTPESARSLTQNQTRLQLIEADVLGMAGPGAAIAAVMPCTVIERGDCIDELLDRSKHPLWRGERSGMLRSMPTNMAAWDDYFEVYARCAQLEPPDFTESNAYYLEHRETLDEGAEASWEERKGEQDVSAIQHAMHLYFRNPTAFMAEYQNSPEAADDGASGAALTADQVLAKVGNLPRGTAPRSATRLTAMIDVGAHLLWWMVVAWDEGFGGCVIDWGCVPDQARAYFSKADPRPALGELPGLKGKGQEAAIYAGLGMAAERVLGRAYRQEETGSELRVERCLVDANLGPVTDLVYEFCRRSPFAAHLVPSHGKGIGATANPMSSWQRRPGERAGPGWRLLPPGGAGRGRHAVVDVNHWKTFVAERLRTPEGAAGCLRLYARAPAAPLMDRLRMLADHLTAEYPVEAGREGARKVQEWKHRPGRDNDLFDCLVGCAVAASIGGLVWSAGAAAGEGAAGAAGGRKKVKWSEVQKAKKQQQAGGGRAGGPRP